MGLSIYYIAALLAAFLYAVGALLIKRASAEGAGVTRILFIINWQRLLLVVPLFFIFGFEVQDGSRWVWTLIDSLCCFIGSVFVLAAIRSGEVSVQTPLMGSKVLFVATFALFFTAAPIPISWWVGAFLTFFAVFILGLPSILKRGVSLVAIFYALSSCAFFALADVIIAREGPIFGELPFLIATTAFVALESLVLIPFFRRSINSIPNSAWGWLLLGGAFMAIEETLMLVSLSFYGRATDLNILYSSRGIWSILLVWFTGHLFANYEKNVGKRVMFLRAVGALLLCVAIVIILMDSP